MPTYDPEYGREKKSDEARQDYLDRASEDDDLRVEYAEERKYCFDEMSEEDFEQWLSERYDDGNFYGKGDPDDRGDR